MGFDEIREMEEEPIDEDVLGELLSPYYGGLIHDAYAVLILYYFRKYDERYGTCLTEGVEIPQVIQGHDAGYEEDYVWLEEMPKVMDNAIFMTGWSAAWISVEDEELQEALERQKKEGEGNEDFRSAYRNCINRVFADDFVKSCFMKEEEEAMEAARYLEEGQIGIMWNEKLDGYMRCRSVKQDMVATVCPEEDRYIGMLSSEIWEPYMVAFMEDMVEHTDGQYAGRKYCRIVMGGAGCNYCWFDSVNPNWIFRAIKLDRMLDLALEKIACYERAKEEEAA